MAVLFWSSLGALLYVYFGYPVLIWIIWRFGNKHSSPNAAHFQTQKVTVLVNLAPRVLKGIESQGMILMTDTPNGKLAFIEPENDSVSNCEQVS